MEQIVGCSDADNASSAGHSCGLHMCFDTLSKLTIELGLPNNASLGHIVETAKGPAAHMKSLQSQVESANGTEKALRGQMKQQRFVWTRGRRNSRR